MRKPFSVIDKAFLRRMLWMLILALFSVLIFWQQTRASAIDPGASGKEVLTSSLIQGLSN